MNPKIISEVYEDFGDQFYLEPFLQEVNKREAEYGGKKYTTLEELIEYLRPYVEYFINGLVCKLSAQIDIKFLKNSSNLPSRGGEQEFLSESLCIEFLKKRGYIIYKEV